MKQFIQAYFNFTKKERRGILTLCSFIIVISFLPSIFHFFIQTKIQTTKNFETDKAST